MDTEFAQGDKAFVELLRVQLPVEVLGPLLAEYMFRHNIQPIKHAYTRTHAHTHKHGNGRHDDTEANDLFDNVHYDRVGNRLKDGRPTPWRSKGEGRLPVW
jgi:hypothetical protein